MIIQEINATINSYDFSGQIIVPSAVITSTPQEEELNLTYTPNFKIEINDSYAYLKNADDVQVEFNFGYNTCTAYATVINRANDVVTLQYNYGLESYATPEPEPEPTIGTVLYNDQPSPLNADSFSGYNGTGMGVISFDVTDTNLDFNEALKTSGAIFVTDSDGNDITSQCSFSSIDYWESQEFDDGEGNLTYKYVLLGYISEDDNNTPYSATINVVWGNQSYNFIINWTQTSNGEQPEEPEEPTETLAMEISDPQGSSYSMEYNAASEMPEMPNPISVGDITLGVSNDNVYTSVVDYVGTMGLVLPTEAYEYLTPNIISGNNHCSLSWDSGIGGFFVTSSNNSPWSDDITVEFELNDQNSSCTILVDDWTGNYSSFEEFVATLPESIQPYVTNNAENRPELPLSVWNGCTANVYFTVKFTGER